MAMTFKKAVKILGGPRRTSRISGVARTVLIYWLKNGPNRFRQTEVDRILSLAAEELATPTMADEQKAGG